MSELQSSRNEAMASRLGNRLRMLVKDRDNVGAITGCRDLLRLQVCTGLSCYLLQGTIALRALSKT